MLQSFKQLDDILRGQATQLPSLQEGQIEIPLRGISAVLLVLGLVYGACMGSYSMIQGADDRFMQLLASTLKFPLLFFLTLLVTFPSLYVFNALIGSRLTIISALRLLVPSLGVMLAVVASLGPIVVFFAACTSSYPFMILLNVAACAVSGILGLGFLLRTLHRLVILQDQTETNLYEPADVPKDDQTSQKESENPEETGQYEKIMKADYCALDRVGRYTDIKAKAVFRIWLLVFALVGAQMSWVLRPFIGNPDLEFAWFRPQESNFFQAVMKTFLSLFGG